MKKYGYKLIIGFVLGLLIFGGTTYAAIIYSSNIIHFDKTNTTLNSTNVQAAITELAGKPEYNLVSCPSYKGCYQQKSTLALGDYVAYTPSMTSFKTDKTITNYVNQQTIKPNELTLWRVINLNPIEIISENVSSNSVSFKGKTGYANLIGYLNVLASKYETTGITTGSRYFGYNGQTETITDTSQLINPPVWKCSTGGTCSTAPVESQGGGDTLYQSDINLLAAANVPLGTGKPNTDGLISYWIAGRNYTYTRDTSYKWNAVTVDTTGTIYNSQLYYYSNSLQDSTSNANLRPIVILSPSLSFWGVGNKEYPMEIITN